MKRKVFINLLVMIISFFIIILTLELTLRVLKYNSQGTWKFNLFDEELGAGPGLELTNDSWIWLDDADFDTSKNDHVIIMEQKVQFKKPKNEIRIVSIGDSFTQGAGVPFDSTYPVCLGRLLKEKSVGNIRVINTGVNASTNVGQYNLLEKKLLKIHPDIVTLGICMSNDLNMNLLPVNFLSPNQGVFWKIIYRLSSVSALFQFCYAKSMIINSKYRIFTIPATYRSPFKVPENTAELRGLNPFDFDQGEVITYLKQESDLMDQAYSLFEEILTGMKALSLKHDFQLIVVLMPTPSAVEKRINFYATPDMEQKLKDMGITTEDLDFEKPTKKVLSICHKLALPCIDPTSEIRKMNSPYLKNDAHLNSSGYRVVAGIMADCFDLEQNRFMEICH